MNAQLRMSTYLAVRKLMQPGDDIMFGGIGPASTIIKVATMSPVSHIGSVLITDHGRVKVIESTTLDGKNGVTVSYMSDILKRYNGEIWFCPLSREVRENLDISLFYSFMMDQKGKKYDYPQAIKSALDIVPFCDNEEDLEKLFCSELRTAALEQATHGKVFQLRGINASEVTPDDCCHQNVHALEYFQILGKPKEIPRFT